jgi:hypothetical protein
MRFPRAGIKQLRVPLAVAMGLSAVLAAPSGASATPSASPTVETVITMDVATGQVLSIKKVEAPVSPDISNDNICQSSDVCWKSGQTPYADQGFFGTPGTLTGSWPYRSSFRTGSYTASGTWIYGGVSHSTGKRGPGTTVVLSGLATATSATIY